VNTLAVETLRKVLHTPPRSLPVKPNYKPAGSSNPRSLRTLAGSYFGRRPWNPSSRRPCKSRQEHWPEMPPPALVTAHMPKQEQRGKPLPECFCTGYINLGTVAVRTALRPIRRISSPWVRSDVGSIVALKTTTDWRNLLLDVVSRSGVVVDPFCLEQSCPEEFPGGRGSAT
jgi:hypothetical protein